MIELIWSDRPSPGAAPSLRMPGEDKRAFEDRAGWCTPAASLRRDLDGDGGGRAVHLIARDLRNGQHLGSLRLLPTTCPHLLEGEYRALCPDGSPRGESIWEISQVMTTPARGQPAGRALRVHRLLALAVVEFGLLNGIDRYLLVASSATMPRLLSIGWRVRPLSLPTKHSGRTLQALEITVCRDTLETLRTRLGMMASMFAHWNADA